MFDYFDYVRYSVAQGMSSAVAHWEAAELEALSEGRLITYSASLVKNAAIW